MKNLNFFDKMLFFINIVVAFLLLTTYTLPFIDPEKNSSIAILSLAYPGLLILNLIFVIFWIIKLKIHFLTSTICILLGLSHVHDFYSFEKKEVIDQKDIKLLSFNVRQFNRLHWIKSPTIKQDISDFINKQNPDIVFFQEYTKTEGISLTIPKVFDYRVYTNGMAIYSRYKVINKGAINFKNTGNNIIYEIIRVYNLHLESFQLDTNKKNYGNKDKTALLKRFKTVFSKQAHQIKTLKKHIKNCPYRTIVAGDFNNTAFSWSYHEIMKGRKDAFKEAGLYFGKSYKYLFPFRIDFILPESSMEVSSFTTYNVNLSDHFPIMARIKLNN